MEYQQMKYFIKAAKHQNFSKAAEELFISPQSVAKQVGLLEKEFHTTLFDRVGRNVVLNSDGEYVLSKLEKLDQEMAETLKDIQQHIQDKNQKVRISFFAALPKKKLVTPLIGTLLTRFPEYQIELKLLSINDTIEQLISQDADIVITNIEENDDIEGIGRIIFQKKPAQIVVAPGHPWWNKQSVTMEEMEQMDFIKIQTAKRLDYNQKQTGIYDRVPCRKAIYVPNFDTMYTVLEQGKAFAVFPDAFTNVDNMEFHFLDLPIKDNRFDTAAVFYKDNDHPAVKQVLAFLKNEWVMP